jgi:hypothetical protein
VLISTAVAIPDEVHTSLSILVWRFVYQSIASQRDASILYTLIFLTIPSPPHGILSGSIYSIRIPNSLHGIYRPLRDPTGKRCQILLAPIDFRPSHLCRRDFITCFRLIKLQSSFKVFSVFKKLFGLGLEFSTETVHINCFFVDFFVVFLSLGFIYSFSSSLRLLR